MTRTRTLGLLCMAAFALSATMATAASAALPEFTGPFPTPFTSTSGATTLETVKKATIKCTADTNAGEVSGAKTGTVTIIFSGCELVVLGLTCNTVGLGPGEIMAGPLVMALGYINGPKKEAGIDLSTATGGPLITALCGPLRVLVDGSVIGKITPVNKVVVPPGHFTLKFTQAAGKQKPTKFEGAPIDVLSTTFGGPFAESGLSSTDTISFGIPTAIAA